MRWFVALLLSGAFAAFSSIAVNAQADRGVMIIDATLEAETIGGVRATLPHGVSVMTFGNGIGCPEFLLQPADVDAFNSGETVQLPQIVLYEIVRGDPDPDPPGCTVAGERVGIELRFPDESATPPLWMASWHAGSFELALVVPSPARPTEPPPPTPGPDTPTPTLPEEGGPPGGVISGYLYVDEDGSGDLSEGDGPAPGSVAVELIDHSGVYHGFGSYSSQTDDDGRWEVRGVADGPYQVLGYLNVWPEEYARTIPPMIIIFDHPPYPEIYASVIEVQMADAQRIGGINFGIPKRHPVFGRDLAPVQLPDTGAGDSNGPAELLAVAAAVTACIAGVSMIAIQRRRRAQ